ncbi:hypothetical protein ACKWTF_016672 [Chironomus riparius]
MGKILSKNDNFRIFPITVRSSLVSGLGLGKFSRPRRDRDRDFPGSLGLDFVIGKAYYDAVRMMNDIATIRGSFAINFPPLIDSIAMSPFFVDVGTITQFSGWNPFTTVNPSILQVTDLEIVPCINSDSMTFTGNQMCAKLIGQESSLIESCRKDPGSFLVANNMLVGINFQHSTMGQN